MSHIWWRTPSNSGRIGELALQHAFRKKFYSPYRPYLFETQSDTTLTHSTTSGLLSNFTTWYLQHLVYPTHEDSGRNTPWRHPLWLRYDRHGITATMLALCSDAPKKQNPPGSTWCCSGRPFLSSKNIYGDAAALLLSRDVERSARLHKRLTHEW